MERKQWFRPHLCAMSQDAPRQFDVCTGPDMPQNQRLASGFASDQGGDELLVAGQDRRPLGDDVAAGRQQDDSRGREADPGGLRDSTRRWRRGATFS